MGGFGSGLRGYTSAKYSTQDYLQLDVRRLQREGLLTPGMNIDLQWSRGVVPKGLIKVRVETGQVVLIYRHHAGGHEWNANAIPVQLTWSPCTFGGQRAWFVCPTHGCGRRVAILYGAKVFTCRHCHRLAYPCQKEVRDDRLIRRGNKIRDRLEWDRGILNGEGSKPKGMHWRTFARLTAEQKSISDRILIGMAMRIGMISGDVEYP